MARHTMRDAIWDQSIRLVISGDPFTTEDVADEIDVTVPTDSIEDVLSSMAEFGWVKELNGDIWNPVGDISAGNLPDNTESIEDDTEPSNEDEPAGKDNEDTDTVTDIDEELINSVDSTVHSVEGAKSGNELKNGRIYIATVDRVNSNAIVSLEQGHVNLGPIDEDAAGERVLFRSIDGIWGRCLIDAYTYDGYQPKDGASPSYSGTNSDTGKIREESSRNMNKLLTGHQ